MGVDAADAAVTIIEIGPAAPCAQPVWGVDATAKVTEFHDKVVSEVRRLSRAVVKHSVVVPRDVASTPEHLYEVVLELRERMPAEYVYAKWSYQPTIRVRKSAPANGATLLERRDATLLRRGKFEPADGLAREANDIVGIFLLLALLATIFAIIWVPALIVVYATTIGVLTQRCVSTGGAEGACARFAEIATGIGFGAVAVVLALVGVYFYARMVWLRKKVARLRDAASPESAHWAAGVLAEHAKRAE